MGAREQKRGDGCRHAEAASPPPLFLSLPSLHALSLYPLSRVPGARTPLPLRRLNRKNETKCHGEANAADVVVVVDGERDRSIARSFFLASSSSFSLSQPLLLPLV